MSYYVYQRARKGQEINEAKQRLLNDLYDYKLAQERADDRWYKRLWLILSSACSS